MVDGGSPPQNSVENSGRQKPPAMGTFSTNSLQNPIIKPWKTPRYKQTGHRMRFSWNTLLSQKPQRGAENVDLFSGLWEAGSFYGISLLLCLSDSLCVSAYSSHMSGTVTYCISKPDIKNTEPCGSASVVSHIYIHPAHKCLQDTFFVSCLVSFSLFTFFLFSCVCVC